jgi:hypothetical protein
MMLVSSFRSPQVHQRETTVRNAPLQALNLPPVGLRANTLPEEHCIAAE